MFADIPAWSEFLGWEYYNFRRLRRPGRLALWEDSFWETFGLDWKDDLFAGGKYVDLRTQFVGSCATAFCPTLLNHQKNLLSVALGGRRGEKEQHVEDIEWGEFLKWSAGGLARVEIVGDSLLVTKWVNAEAFVLSPEVASSVNEISACIHRMVTSGLVTFRTCNSSPMRHVRRCWNTEADALAHGALDGVPLTSIHCTTFLLLECTHFRVMYDGACRGNPGIGSAGWLVQGRKDDQCDWNKLLVGAIALGVTTSVQAECMACLHGIDAF